MTSVLFAHILVTIAEYVVQQPPQPQPPAFVFVVDTCIMEDELKQLKASLLLAIMQLPPQSRVALITFGRNIHLHELSFEDCAKSFVFRGTKTLTASQLASALNIRQTSAAPSAAGPFPSSAPVVSPTTQTRSRFLLPIGECEFQLTQVIESMQKDCWQPAQGDRAERCTGSALALALSLLELSCKGQSSRVMLFMGGPATVGDVSDTWDPPDLLSTTFFFSLGRRRFAQAQGDDAIPSRSLQGQRSTLQNRLCIL